jgi:hypothetical protein
LNQLIQIPRNVEFIDGSAIRAIVLKWISVDHGDMHLRADNHFRGDLLDCKLLYVFDGFEFLVSLSIGCPESSGPPLSQAMTEAQTIF